MSRGDRFSPGRPPIVPLIPEMLLINATGARFNEHKNKVFRCSSSLPRKQSEDILLSVEKKQKGCLAEHRTDFYFAGSFFYQRLNTYTMKQFFSRRLRGWLCLFLFL